MLDALRLEAEADVAAVSAVQVRDLVIRLVEARQWRPGDPEILLVFDVGYDLPRLAFLLADLPVEVDDALRHRDRDRVGSAATGLPAVQVDLLWQAFLRRFDLSRYVATYPQFLLTATKKGR
ncbi:hypothetical protein ACTMTI_18595 [Nonomuraea sp. H19]|uniref:hypothetical protein n=1 Tax=Nonomuraea sp. H19 TaxID=3452206 RepID=UPI003F8993D4